MLTATGAVFWVLQLRKSKKARTTLAMTKSAKNTDIAVNAARDGQVATVVVSSFAGVGAVGAGAGAGVGDGVIFLTMHVPPSMTNSVSVLNMLLMSHASLSLPYTIPLLHWLSATMVKFKFNA